MEDCLTLYYIILHNEYWLMCPTYTEYWLISIYSNSSIKVIRIILLSYLLLILVVVTIILLIIHT